MNIKLFPNLALLIINLINISCDLDFFRNQFSIYFNRAYNKYYREENLGDESINHLLYNNIFTELKIDQFPEKIFIFLTFNNSDINIVSPTYLNSVSYNKDMEQNNTYILKKDKLNFPKSEIFFDINFNLNIKEKDIKKFEKNAKNSYLGLAIQSNNNKNSFITQLKDNKIISHRRFSLLFKEYSITADSKYDGQVLFGLLPHEISARYNEKDLYWSSIINGKSNNNNDLKWKIKFDSIYYNEEKESLDVREAEFDIGLNMIIGPEEYRQKIVNNYFNKFITEKLCQEEIFYNKFDKDFYISYSCINNLDIQYFPTLLFQSKDLNETFIMGYEQLLSIFKSRIYLKVIFKKNGGSKRWILGRAFMEVFPLIFDVDNKKIGYYKIKLNESHPVYLFIFFILMIIIFIWGIYKGIQHEKRKNMEVIKKKKDDDFKGENGNNNERNKKGQNPENKKVLKNNDEKTKLINKNK